MSERALKKQIFSLLLENDSVFVHIAGTHPSVVVPAHLHGKDQVVLQLGFNMPVPINDLEYNDEGVAATLSFKGKPGYCFVPWDAVFALVGEDGKGKVWDREMPASVKEELRKASSVENVPVQKHGGFRLIQGGKA